MVKYMGPDTAAPAPNPAKMPFRIGGWGGGEGRGEIVQALNNPTFIFILPLPHTMRLCMLIRFCTIGVECSREDAMGLKVGNQKLIPPESMEC